MRNRSGIDPKPRAMAETAGSFVNYLLLRTYHRQDVTELNELNSRRSEQPPASPILHSCVLSFPHTPSPLLAHRRAPVA